MKTILTLFAIVILSSMATGQSVSISENGAEPDSSAILDISSQTKGFLLPRMNALERIEIASPQTGLLVYDLDLQSLFYFDGGQWVEFASSRKGLRDSDFDTKVMVEQSIDDDTIRMVAGGVEKIKVHSKGISYDADFDNMSIGKNQGETGLANMVIGHNSAGNFSQTASNVVIGNDAFRNAESAASNTVIGHQAGDSIAGGSENVLIGYQAFLAQTGSGNVSIGAQSGHAHFGSLFDNVFIGRDAGMLPQGGQNNVMIGSSAGQSGAFSNNTVAIGKNTGSVNGSINSIFIGTDAGSTQVDAFDCIFIGPNTGGLAGFNLSDKLVIDNETTDEPLILGDFNLNTLRFYGNVGVQGGANSELQVNHGNNGDIAGLTIQNESNANYWRLYTRSANGSLRFYSTDGEGNLCGNNSGADEYVAWVSSCSGAWNSTSDFRKKKNFDDLQKVLPKIMDLNVLKYHFLSEENAGKKHIGLIAQEVENYFPELVSYDEELDLYTMSYDGFGPIAIKGVQELKRENDKLKAELDAVKSDIVFLKNELSKLVRK